ncbi:MAG TPA: metal ABC transporter substrate-binding protein [Candidatus Krumholzibacteria bacterium]|nr:metal ABC transporter substrate-binding protein [Candidatus Krumholzibacteria bacterium]
MKRTLLLLLLIAVATNPVAAKVSVVASTTDLAAIATFVGGDAVEVTSIARGTSDPHFVEVLPSYMVRVQKAKLYLKLGMDIDRWAAPIIDGSRNGKLVIVDCSSRIAPLNVPTGKVDASMGDVHARGNPHYWLDPDNGVIIATTIADALSGIDPENTSAYLANLERFKAELAARRTRWSDTAGGLRGMKMVTYHDSWPYFSRAFGVEIEDFVEPLPGIEPTPSHTAKVIDMIKAQGIRVIGVEPYFSKRTPETIARATGAVVVELPPSVGGAPGATDYFSLFDVLIDRLMKAGR